MVQDFAHLPIGSFGNTSEGKVVGRNANDGKVAGTHTWMMAIKPLPHDTNKILLVFLLRDGSLTAAP